jgi:hypothetical protein
MGGPICGTNNRTYHSWCHMLKDACATGFVIETKFSGSCDLGGMYISENDAKIKIYFFLYVCALVTLILHCSLHMRVDVAPETSWASKKRKLRRFFYNKSNPRVGF